MGYVVFPALEPQRIFLGIKEKGVSHKKVNVNKDALFLDIAENNHVQVYNSNYFNTPGPEGILKQKAIALLEHTRSFYIEFNERNYKTM